MSELSLTWFHSRAEQEVAKKLGFVVRPSVSQSHSADLIVVEFTDLNADDVLLQTRVTPVRVVPATAMVLATFNLAMQYAHQLEYVLTQLREDRERAEQAANAAPRAVVDAASAPVRPEQAGAQAPVTPNPS